MSKKFSLFLKIFFLLLCIGLGITSYISYTAWNFIHTPANKNAIAFPVEIPQGSSLQHISTILHNQKIITDTTKFKLYAQIKGTAQNIQAGTFLLSPAWSPEKILSELTTGSAILYKVTIREGLPWWEVAKIFEEQGFCTVSDFQKAFFDKDFLAKKNIPFDCAEGYLYPDTYLLHKPKEMTEEIAYKTIGRLIDTFYEKTAPLRTDEQFKEIFNTPNKLNELLTLASIVEKETRLEEERPIVAGVYDNRLRLGMILQADPTVIYGLGKEFKGPLLRKHLQDAKNPYNTYQHLGLPPSPICSPSLSAIRASLTPMKHNYLFFVAKGIGASHVFSTNLDDHNVAVQEYKNNLKQNKNK